MRLNFFNDVVNGVIRGTSVQPGNMLRRLAKSVVVLMLYSFLVRGSK